MEEVKVAMASKMRREFDEVKKRVEHHNWDYVCVIAGLPGCITGDIIIRTNRNTLGRKFSIKYIYNQFHNNPDKIIQKNKQWNLNVPTYVRSYNGKDIRLNKIKDVVYSGKKRVYNLFLENNKSIKATADHKIMTNRGYVELLKLDIKKDLVMCDTPNTNVSKYKKEKIIDIEISGVKFHPRAMTKTRPRIFLHQAIYESHLNKLTLEKYIKIISNEKGNAKKLTYIPNGYFIHHKDGNHFNNEISNMELITPQEHSKLHGKKNYINFGQGNPRYVKIVGIKEVGVRDTYDIQCKKHHNFSANDIIIHNSGKSTFARGCAKYCCSWFDVNYIAFTSEEFITLTNNCPEYSAVVLDESFQSMNTRVTMSPDFLRIINHLSILRQKHLYIFLCLPNFFDLSKGIAVFRTSHLFVTYEKEGARGRVLAFGRDTKRRLYVRGSRYMDYDCVRSNFATRYYKNSHILPEEEYEKRKRQHLMDQDKKIAKIKEPDHKRNVLMWNLRQKAGMRVKDIAKLAGVVPSTVSEVLKRVAEAKKNEEDMLKVKKDEPNVKKNRSKAEKND